MQGTTARCGILENTEESWRERDMVQPGITDEGRGKQRNALVVVRLHEMCNCGSTTTIGYFSTKIGTTEHTVQ